MNQQARTIAMTETERWTMIRERFLRDSLPVRLGELSSSLSETKLIADQTALEKFAVHYLNTTAHYLEWGFPDADSVLQAELTELSQLIAQLKENWKSVWENPAERTAIGASFTEWSQKMLDRSGLLDYDDWREVFRSVKPAVAIGAAAKQ